MDDDSEDVVFLNSPLHEYLKATAFDISNYEEKDIQQYVGHKTVDHFKKKDEILWEKLKKSVHFAWKNFTTAAYNAFIPEIKTLERKFAHESYKVIIDSNLLIEEDKAFLKSFFNEAIWTDKNDYCNRSWIKTTSLLLALCIFFSLSTSAHTVFCYFISLYSFLNLYQELTQILCFMISFYLLVFILRKLLFTYLQKRCSFGLADLKTICANLGEMNFTLKKCFRIIQEAELIARGFTYASVCGLAQRLELSTTMPLFSPERQHPEFRKSLFSWVKNTFLRYRTSTLEIIKDLPGHNSLDAPSHYLATLSLSEYGDLIELDMNNEQQISKLFKISDGFSLSAIKSVFQLMEVQVSEFFKVFCLNICGIFEKNNSKRLVGLKKLKQLLGILPEVLSCNESTLAEVKNAYRYYRSHAKSNQTESTVLPERKISPLSGLFISIHSSGLHLKAALNRIVTLEDMLDSEEHCFEEEMPSNDVHHLEENLCNLLLQAKAELNACNHCFSDSFSRFEALFPKNVKVKDCIPPAPVEIPNFSQATKVSIIPSEDPIIVDEVFEGYVSSMYMAPKNSKNSELLSSETKFQKFNNAVLRELKSVLVCKAEEHQLRERVALNSKLSKEQENIANDEDICRDEANSDYSLNIMQELCNARSLDSEEHKYVDQNQTSLDPSIREKQKVIPTETTLLSYESERNIPHDLTQVLNPVLIWKGEDEKLKEKIIPPSKFSGEIEVDELKVVLHSQKIKPQCLAKSNKDENASQQTNNTIGESGSTIKNRECCSSLCEKANGFKSSKNLELNNVTCEENQDHQSAAQKLSSVSEKHLSHLDNIEQDFQYFPSMNKTFASSIAALAAERNKLLGYDAEERIGDSSDSD